MKYKYGTFSPNQIADMKQYIRKRIFFLLLIVDPNTKYQYEHIDVRQAFDAELRKIAGLNSLLSEPVELVLIMSMLESALMEYNKSEFDWQKYRKLILDAGSEVCKIPEV